MTVAATYTSRVLLRGEETNGSHSVIEMHPGPDFAGPPLHIHDFDETFVVLEGELTFQHEQHYRVAGPGELVFAARGVAHTLANLSGAPARYLLLCTPAGFERHLARAAAQAAGVEPPDWAAQPGPEVTIVGSPISAADIDRRTSTAD